MREGRVPPLAFYLSGETAREVMRSNHLRAYRKSMIIKFCVSLRSGAGLINLLLFLCLFQPSLAGAAPHISGRPETKLDHVGTALHERSAAKALAPAILRAPTAYPAEVSILFLRVDFQDESSNDTNLSVCYSTLPAPVNGDRDPNTTGLGTWSDPVYSYNSDPDYWLNLAKLRFPQYYTEASYNKLAITIDVSSAVYRLPMPMCYYGTETDDDLQRLVVDSAALTTGIDLSLYDAVLIVHAGAGEEADVNSDSSRDLWSLYYSADCIDTDAAAAGCQLLPSLRNGAAFNEFIIMPQTNSQDGITVDPFGIYVHEFGHWLGLPDLYDTSWLYPTDGIGVWGLMGYGLYNGDPAGSMPPHPEAWSKIFLGWISQEQAAAGVDAGPMTLEPVMSSAPRVIRIPASSVYSETQYFLVENRRKTGYDSALPGEGMLVWLVNEAYINANLLSNTVNVRARGVRLVEADGLYNLLNGADGDEGSPDDPIPGAIGKKMLTPLSAPSSAPFTDQAWVSLRDIVEQSQDVSFTLGYAPLPPRDLSPSSQGPDAVLNWTLNAETDVAHYNIYREDVLWASPQSPPYTDAGAGSGHTYKVTAVDASGNESGYSQTVTIQAPSGGGGGGCFIATAAFGSYLDPDVKALREFRDRRLLTNALGRMFVGFYYRHSPPVAAYICRHEGMRTVVRFALTPIVLAVQYPVAICVVFLGVIGVGLRRVRASIVRS